MFLCELCGSNAKEGDYGQSKYICENRNCDRSNPNWAYVTRNKIIKPFIEKQEQFCKFSKGTIDFYDARWVGKGSAEIILEDGTKFMCHVKDDKFVPFDNPYFAEMGIDIQEDVIKEIKTNMLKLIELREAMSKVNF